MPSTESSYKALYEGHDWLSAGDRCQEIRPGSHLAVITSAEKNKALRSFLASEISSMFNAALVETPGAT